MSIFEYDEEKHMKSEREEWREIGRQEGFREGHEEGHKEGHKEGRNDLARILKNLMDSGKDDVIKRALSDQEYREQLYREYDR